MAPNRCLILRNAAGVTELIPLDKVLHVEFTEGKPNAPQYYEERIVLRLANGEPLTYTGPEAAAVWKQLVFHFDAGTLLETDGSTTVPPWSR
jgi:hypothetical protein